MATRKDLVAAARDLNKVLDLEPVIDVTKAADVLKAGIILASDLLTEKDPIQATTQAIIQELKTPVTEPATDGETVTKAKPKPKPKAKAKAEATEKPVKLGSFNVVRKNTLFGKILQLALTGPTLLTDAADAADVDVEKVKLILKKARTANGIDHTVDGNKFTVTLPKDVTVETVWFKPRGKAVKSSGEPKPRAARAAGKPAKGKDEFHPLRKGTIRGNIYEKMDGTRTVETIATELSLDRGNCSSHIFCLWRDCGFGFSYADGGFVTVILPEGVTSAFKE